MRAVIETPRLVLRPAGRTDLDALHAIWVDPDVRRHLWDGEVIPRERAATVLDASDADFAARRFGMWVVQLHATGDPIGFCGLRTVPDTCAATTDRAGDAAPPELVDTLDRPRMLGVTDAPNAASIRVLERLGMTPVGRRAVGGRDTVVFELGR